MAVRNFFVGHGLVNITGIEVCNNDEKKGDRLPIRLGHRTRPGRAAQGKRTGGNRNWHRRPRPRPIRRIRLWLRPLLLPGGLLRSIRLWLGRAVFWLGWLRLGWLGWVATDAAITDAAITDAADSVAVDSAGAVSASRGALVASPVVRWLPVMAAEVASHAVAADSAMAAVAVMAAVATDNCTPVLLSAPSVNTILRGSHFRASPRANHPSAESGHSAPVPVS